MICDSRCEFDEYYICAALPAVKALERDILGSDYGGTSWTTSEQAAQLTSLLKLDSTSHLLEVGSGSGWPSLYISTHSGCDVTLLDLPLIALEQARERAVSDDIIEQVTLVNGSGTSLPFADASFDRLSHSDVLCCLPEKLEMLQECRRVAADDALMAFFVIEPATGLSAADHEQVVDVGPPFIEVPEGYRHLLHESGWQLLDCIDINEEFGRTTQKEFVALQKNIPALQEAYGADELRDMTEKSGRAIDLIEANKLLRFIYVVTAKPHQC